MQRVQICVEIKPSTRPIAFKKLATILENPVNFRLA